MRRATQRPLLALLGWLLLCFVVAAVGAAASVSASAFYAALVKPAWAPPAGVFGPVWSVLYLLMGVAAWRVWCRGGWRERRGALQLFVLQLALNGLWSWLFFGWRMGGAAFADIVLLILVLLATMVGFWRASRLATLLLVPYLAWISFASVLNWAVWRANPGLLG